MTESDPTQPQTPAAPEAEPRVLTFEELKGIVDMKQVKEILAQIIGKSGDEVLPTSVPLKRYDADVRTFADVAGRLDDLTYTEITGPRANGRPAPMASGGHVGNKPHIFINTAGFNLALQQVRALAKEQNWDAADIEARFMTEAVMLALIHEAVHVAAYSTNAEVVQATADPAIVRAHQFSQLGYSASHEVRDIPYVQGKSISWQDPGAVIVQEVEHFRWLNEAMTERLARQVAREYFRRTGNRAALAHLEDGDDKPHFKTYQPQIQVLDMILGALAKATGASPQDIWESAVQSNMADPRAFVGGFSRIFKSVPALDAWNAKYADFRGFRDAAAASAMRDELKDILTKIKIPPETIEAELHLS